jgi:type II secretory pathway pseudopilin PulG
MKMSKGASRSGITLIEILISISLLSAFTWFIVFPLLGYKHSQELEGQVSTIVAALRDAQQRSVTREDGARWGVRFINVVSGEDTFQIIRGPAIPSGDICTTTYEIDSEPVPTETIPITPQLIKHSMELVLPVSGSVRDVVFESISGKPITCGGTYLDVSVAIKITGTPDPEGTVITVFQNGTVTY